MLDMHSPLFRHSDGKQALFLVVGLFAKRKKILLGENLREPEREVIRLYHVEFRLVNARDHFGNLIQKPEECDG